MITKN